MSTLKEKEHTIRAVIAISRTSHLGSTSTHAFLFPPLLHHTWSQSNLMYTNFTRFASSLKNTRPFPPFQTCSNCWTPLSTLTQWKKEKFLWYIHYEWRGWNEPFYSSRFRNYPKNKKKRAEIKKSLLFSLTNSLTSSSISCAIPSYAAKITIWRSTIKFRIAELHELFWVFFFRFLHWLFSVRSAVTFFFFISSFGLL